ncbi:hypothetical protein B0A55_05259 [Friedmanniomyces simplex]|uniref:Uncharacterized protein n=1 Tax=Friedmanniomyces simplex TaxID=329884 RepID=A0A4U0XHA0_9PEZI|nr:hypothetical protein B0A55_05259 [Friedmanniomyces simplex]
MQELLIVGSTTAVVMHVLRHELISGVGVPFGLLGGGFQFSGLSYFWAPEFWGAMLHAPLTFRKKATLAGTLLVAGLVAVSAGPSCAILLVPREQTWNAGHGTFYLPGSNEMLWSTDFASSMAPFDDCCFWPNASSYATCPSGGYADLWSAFGEAGLARNKPPELDWTAARLSGSETKVAMSNALTDWTRLTNFAQIELATRGVSCQTSAVGIHGPTSVILARLMNDWFNAVLQIQYSPSWPSKSEYKYWDTRQIKAASKAPVSNVQFPSPTGRIRTTWTDPGEPNVNTLEDILTNAGIAKGLDTDAAYTDTEQWNYVNVTSGLNRTTSVERVLALLVADGLSRYGTSLVYGLDNSGSTESTWPNRGGWNQTTTYAKNLVDGRGRILFPPSGDYVTQEAEIQITGLAGNNFSYDRITRAPGFAISVPVGVSEAGGVLPVSHV